MINVDPSPVIQKIFE